MDHADDVIVSFSTGEKDLCPDVHFNSASEIITVIINMTENAYYITVPVVHHPTLKCNSRVFQRKQSQQCLQYSTFKGRGVDVRCTCGNSIILVWIYTC